jgi:hypothetical protein
MRLVLPRRVTGASMVAIIDDEPRSEYRADYETVMADKTIGRIECFLS